MAALLWLLIPVFAGVVASVWGGWAARRRTVIPDAVGLAGYERFRVAMARTHGGMQEAAAPGPSGGLPANRAVLPPVTGGASREAP